LKDLGAFPLNTGCIRCDWGNYTKALPGSPIALTGLGGTLSNYNTPTADFSMTKNNLEHQIKIEEEEKSVI
jgi:hypothetical protein